MIAIQWELALTYNTGNHAQGVAYSARHLKIPATIVMPSGTPAIKHLNVSRQLVLQNERIRLQYDDAGDTRIPGKGTMLKLPLRLEEVLQTLVPAQTKRAQSRRHRCDHTAYLERRAHTGWIQTIAQRVVALFDATEHDELEIRADAHLEVKVGYLLVVDLLSRISLKSESRPHS